MALTQVTGPYPIFTDLDGSPLDDGYLYIGAVNQDPETNPIQAYWDSNLTIPATQPIRTNNGYAWRNGTPGLIYTAGQFSITIRNKKSEFVLYSPVGYGFDPAAVSASVVKNDFTGDGVETDFTLSAAPSTILATNAFINGVYQEKDSYTLTGNVLTFSVAPPLNSSIEIMTNETGVINSTNASLVSYTLTAPGAVGQTVQTKLEQYVSVKDFGAVGDGVTDDTAAIQAAIDFMAVSGGELTFPPGTYIVTAPLTGTFADNINISIRGYGAKIDATAVSTLNVISLGGSRVSSTPLGGNVSKNANTFTVTSASGITGGRILLITSTDLWVPGIPTYFKGELALVEQIASTTITNSNPMYDGYTAATTTVHLLDMPQITVEGLEIECDDDVIALTILYARNPVVRNCKVYGSRYAGVYVGYCLGGTVDSNFIYDVWNGTITGTSYGVVVGTGQGVKVVNNTINNTRHAISGGGFEPLREAVYANNTCHNSSLENNVGCLDIHANVELALITGNVASSVICQGINATISNNILRNNEPTVPTILVLQVLDSDYCIIKGNRVIHTSSDVSAFGIAVRAFENNTTIKSLSIEGNCVDTVSRAVSIQPRNSSVTGTSIGVLSVIGNQFKTTGTSPAFVCSNDGAATITVDELISSGNVYHAENWNAFISTGNPITATVSVGDTFKANVLNGYLAYFCGTDVRLTSPSFYGSVGGAGNSRSVYYENTGRVVVTNPVFSNMTFKAELASATEYVENGWHSLTPTILNTSGARLINFYGTLGRAITYGTAAPVAGTWALGDRVFNQDPAIGQPKSWVCTVAGTPGTWVSEGNL